MRDMAGANNLFDWHQSANVPESQLHAQQSILSGGAGNRWNFPQYITNPQRVVGRGKIRGKPSPTPIIPRPKFIPPAMVKHGRAF